MLRAPATARREGMLALLHALPDAAALLDSDGRVVAVNAACRALLGPALRAEPGDAAAAWFAGAAPLANGMRALADASDGATHIDLALVPLGADGALLRLCTTRAAQEDRLALVGRMAGGVAHDFNNLLAIMRGAAEMARRALDHAALRAELQVLDNAADRGAALVRGLLAFARQQVLAPEILDVNARVGAMAELLRRLLGPRITLDVALEEPGRRVQADPAQLDQVLLNLAVNARDAMGGAGRIRFATETRLVLRAEGSVPPGRYVAISVQDSGPGIPADVLPRIFEPFFSTRIEQGGTGLGLATVQGIVAQSGGHVLAENVPGGARFTMLLPRAEGEVAPMPTPTPAAGPLRVLLVDDEPLLLRLGRRALEEAGHHVTTAETGEEALELLDEAAPHMLVSDIAMPGMDGAALAQAAVARRPALRVLLLSGYAASALQVDWAATGWRYLAKPFTPAALTAAVGGWTGSENQNMM
ncbi:MAG: response regulator [Alphaproteobacteria bacterium]|jgi:two-component system cell cycle sensor histidine kinase/response regulator CckA|nr:response regulator [Alphaproteobacteria bacterium]